MKGLATVRHKLVTGMLLVGLFAGFFAGLAVVFFANEGFRNWTVTWILVGTLTGAVTVAGVDHIGQFGDLNLPLLLSTEYRSLVVLPAFILLAEVTSILLIGAIAGVSAGQCTVAITIGVITGGVAGTVSRVAKHVVAETVICAVLILAVLHVFLRVIGIVTIGSITGASIGTFIGASAFIVVEFTMPPEPEATAVCVTASFISIVLAIGAFFGATFGALGIVNGAITGAVMGAILAEHEIVLDYSQVLQDLVNIENYSRAVGALTVCVEILKPIDKAVKKVAGTIITTESVISGSVSGATIGAITGYTGVIGGTILGVIITIYLFFAAINAIYLVGRVWYRSAREWIRKCREFFNQRVHPNSRESDASTSTGIISQEDVGELFNPNVHQDLHCILNSRESDDSTSIINQESVGELFNLNVRQDLNCIPNSRDSESDDSTSIISQEDVGRVIDKTVILILCITPLSAVGAYYGGHLMTLALTGEFGSMIRRFIGCIDVFSGDFNIGSLGFTGGLIGGIVAIYYRTIIVGIRDDCTVNVTFSFLEPCIGAIAGTVASHLAEPIGLAFWNSAGVAIWAACLGALSGFLGGVIVIKIASEMLVTKVGGIAATVTAMVGGLIGGIMSGYFSFSVIFAGLIGIVFSAISVVSLTVVVCTIGST